MNHAELKIDGVILNIDYLITETIDAYGTEDGYISPTFYEVDIVKVTCYGNILPLIEHQLDVIQREIIEQETETF